MLTETVGAAPAANRSTYRTTKWVVRFLFGVHAGLVAAQPVLAGLYLSGNLDAISVHSAIGGSLIPVGFLAWAAALVHCWPGRGPVWPAAVMTAVVIAEVVQVSAGYSRTLGLHVPLGVSIVGTTLGLFGWSVLSRERIRGRRTQGPPTPIAPAATP